MSFAGRRILVVEDEAIIALAIEDMLREFGCDIVGPALTLQAAERLVRDREIDGAVLDINLSGDNSDTIAGMLRQRAIPFCFSTGYGAAEVPEGHGDVPLLQKPYSSEALAAVLGKLFSP